MKTFGPKNSDTQNLIVEHRYIYEDLSGSQDDSDATLNYYVDMQGYSFFSIQYLSDNGSDGYKTLTVHASNEDVADITAATYIDITSEYFASADFQDVDVWLEKGTPTSMKYMRIDVAVTGLNPGDSASWDMFITKKGA